MTMLLLLLVLQLLLLLMLTRTQPLTVGLGYGTCYCTSSQFALLSSGVDLALQPCQLQRVNVVHVLLEQLAAVGHGGRDAELLQQKLDGVVVGGLLRLLLLLLVLLLLLLLCVLCLLLQLLLLLLLLVRLEQQVRVQAVHEALE